MEGNEWLWISRILFVIIKLNCQLQLCVIHSFLCVTILEKFMKNLFELTGIKSVLWINFAPLQWTSNHFGQLFSHGVMKHQIDTVQLVGQSTKKIYRHTMVKIPGSDCCRRAQKWNVNEFLVIAFKESHNPKMCKQREREREKLNVYEWLSPIIHP